MLDQIAIGGLLMVLTTFVHAGGTLAALEVLRRPRFLHWGLRRGWTRVFLIASLVLMMFFAALVEVGLWAAAYRFVGAFPAPEAALYFSTVTYTTLGYGDITLGDNWRLLSSFQAANGIIMFGWTTALIFAFVQRVASHDQALAGTLRN